jgi:hypothetical protein
LIEIAPGTYPEQIVLRSNVRLKGSGRDQTWIVPPDEVRHTCGGSNYPALALCDVSRVEVSHMTIAGEGASRGRFEVAIRVADAFHVSVHETRIESVFVGLDVERTRDFAIVNNDIPDPADAIVGRHLSGVARIEANETNGRFRLDSEGTVRVVGNRIVGGPSVLTGAILASNNFIDGDVFLESNLPSVFSDNRQFGHLELSGASSVVVVGNSLREIRDDNGKATIVGNYLSSGSPVQLAQGSRSTVFANHYPENLDPASAAQRLITSHVIELQSTEESVVIKAGASSIVIDSSGGISIESTGDVAIRPTGRFSVVASEISLEAAGAASLKSGGNMTLDTNAAMDLEAAASMNLKAGGVMDLEAPFINVN